MSRLILCFLFSLGLTGCLQTRQTEADRIARERALQQRQQQQQLSEYRRRTQLQIEDAEARMEDMDKEIRSLRTELAARPTNADLQKLEQRVEELEKQIRDLDRRRKQDREEMLDILSKRMAEILAARPAPHAGGQTHVVSQGETLSAIASAYRVSSQAIIRANQLNNPDNLKIGQKLIIPGN